MAADLNSFLNEFFHIESKDIRTYSPLTLAYIGDAVFDIIIRSVLVNKGNTSVNKLHTRASGIVKAQTQAALVKALLDEMTEEETDYYRRGRNSKPHTRAKNASAIEYLEATGFEAVMGFLYMTGDIERACYLIETGLKKIDVDILN